MLFFGYCGQGHHGEIYLLTLATGRIRIEDFADGEIGESGKKYLKLSLLSLILSG